MRKKVLFLAVVLLASCATSYRGKLDPENVPKGETVLIATEDSEFKQALVAKITADLEKKHRAYRVTKLADLKNQFSGSHEAVVLVHSVWAWRLSTPVSRFLRRARPERRSRLILVSTAGDEDWDAQLEGVHAITSASELQEVDKVCKYVVEKIDGILQKHSGPAAR